MRRQVSLTFAVVWFTLSMLSGNVVLPVVATADEFPQPGAEVPLTESDRDHWSFRPIVRPEIPAAADPQIAAHPIDCFIARQLQSESLRLQPTADRRVLLRRLSFDLTGLPPSLADLDSFQSDTSAIAFENQVDRLLASDHFGERWAQHWLDLARFAETDGFEHDIERPDAWQFRDWVIDAINRDLPYDEFLRLQIAGDELQPGDSDALTATQFLFSGPDMPDINDQLERKHTLLNDMTATVGTAVLGLQIGCAQCHDHKYDPISQVDFHRLKAVFEPSVQLNKNKPSGGFSETAPFDQPSYLLIRGDFRRRGPPVAPGFIRVLNADRMQLTGMPTFAAKGRPSSGRRTSLARWLTDRSNPLTSRVLVNRVWQQHFGTGLSSSPADFGVMGQEPSHPELLDWLADWFMSEGWSLKKLHRLILTSATWKQRSRLPANATPLEAEHWQKALEIDSDLRLLSRFPRRRLDGESMRDAMLVSAGVLNLKRGGPGIRPPLPAEIADTLLPKQWIVTPDPAEHDRRSVYIFSRRNLRYPMFETFDRPDANISCPQRHQSTTALQALHLLNSPESADLSLRMARNLILTFPTTAAQIDAAFERTLCRRPTAEEARRSRELLQNGQDNGVAVPLAQLCLALFNVTEFVWID